MPRRLTLSVFLLLLPLFWGPVCQYAAGAGLNVTEQEENMPILRTLSTPRRTEMPSMEVDSEEEDVKELMVPQFLVGDSKRVLPQVKKSAKSESGKKNSKKRGNKGKKNKKKNQTPCEREFKNFCVHGDCVYIEDLQRTTCRCHSDYFGERCVEQFLKTHKSNDAANRSSTVIVVWTVVPSLLGFAVIVIIVIVQVRAKCPKYDEKEERKKLRQENGSSSSDV